MGYAEYDEHRRRFGAEFQSVVEVAAKRHVKARRLKLQSWLLDKKSLRIWNRRNGRLHPTSDILGRLAQTNTYFDAVDGRGIREASATRRGIFNVS